MSTHDRPRIEAKSSGWASGAGQPCPACSGNDVVGTGLTTQGRYRLWSCADCATQFFDDSAVGYGDSQSHYKWESYKLDVYKNEAVRRAFELRYRALLDRAEPAGGSLGSVLDVGCGIGNFVAFAGRLGLRAIGSDVSPRAVEEARSQGLDVVLADDLDVAVPDGSMDAMTLWDVIEHVQDPAAFLARLVPKVRPGGVLLLETPDGEFPVRSMLLRLNRWTRGKIDLTGPMYYWEHKIYFSEKGLRALLRRCGAEVVHVERQTSVREKMQQEFAHKRSLKGRVLQLTWPVLELVFRRAGRGNKLLLIARRASA